MRTMITRTVYALAYTLVLTATVPHADGLRCYHVGNSLTDSQGELTKLLAHAAGHTDHYADRHTIPGAPIGWLYSHPDGGFGTGYTTALGESPPSPWDHLTLQPHIGHGRSAEKRAIASKSFYTFAVPENPNIQLWHYFNYRSPTSVYDHDEPTLYTLDEWLEVMHTCVEWHEAGYFATADSLEPLGHTPLALPCDRALISLGHAVKSGEMPGAQSGRELFEIIYGHGGYNIHMSEGGRYYTALVHFAGYYKESPEGLPSVARNDRTNELTDEQISFMQRIAWETAKAYPYAAILDNADNQAPSAPDGLRVTDRTVNGVTLSWNPSADNGDILGYELFVDGNRKAFADRNSVFFTDWAYSQKSGMEPGESHRYQVRAIDAGGNVSPLSTTLEVATLDEYRARDAEMSDDVSGDGPYRRIEEEHGWLEWTDVNSSRSSATLKVFYTNTDIRKLPFPCAVIVNGTAQDTIEFPATIPFHNIEYKTVSVPVECNEGANTIRLQAITGDGSAQIDNIALLELDATEVVRVPDAHAEFSEEISFSCVGRVAVAKGTKNLVATLYTLDGRRIGARASSAGTLSLNLSQFPPGSYIMQVEQHDKRIARKVVLR